MPMSRQSSSPCSNIPLTPAVGTGARHSAAATQQGKGEPTLPWGRMGSRSNQLFLKRIVIQAVSSETVMYTIGMSPATISD